MRQQKNFGRCGPGEMEYTGWVDYPVRCSEEEIHRLEETADGLRGNSEVFWFWGLADPLWGQKQ